MLKLVLPSYAMLHQEYELAERLYGLAELADLR